jgi:hypothetical protein
MEANLRRQTALDCAGVPENRVLREEMFVRRAVNSYRNGALVLRGAAEMLFATRLNGAREVAGEAR